MAKKPAITRLYERPNKAFRYSIDLTPSLQARFEEYQKLRGGVPAAILFREALDAILPELSKEMSL